MLITFAGGKFITFVGIFAKIGPKSDVFLLHSRVITFVGIITFAGLTGGEKSGKLLARQLKRQDNSNNIPMIKKGDKVITSNKGINEVFEEFYRNLYTSECKPSEEETDAFFSGLEIPTAIHWFGCKWYN